MNPIAKYLLRFTTYLIEKVVTPKTLLNRMALGKIFTLIDKFMIERRTHYLDQFARFEKELISYPRVLREEVITHLISIPQDQKGADLLLLNLDLYRDQSFATKINEAIKDVHVYSLDHDSQVAYSDIWDHLTYGMMVATVAVELGNIAGPPGSINKARLALLVKEPPRRKKSEPVSSTPLDKMDLNGIQIKDSASLGKTPKANTLPTKDEKPPFSCGPFQIYEDNWNVFLSDIESLPSDNFYVHGAHFFKIARYAHKQVMNAFARTARPFEGIDDTWLVDLYEKRDLFSYLLLWRRYYGGAGSYYGIPDPLNPSKQLNAQKLFIRNMAFAVTALSVMRCRDRFYKSYPSSKIQDDDLLKMGTMANSNET